MIYLHFEYYSVISEHLLQVFSLRMSIKSPNWQRSARNRRGSETSTLSAKSKTPFPPKYRQLALNLPHLKDSPTKIPHRGAK